MSSSKEEREMESARRQWFTTTHWSVVLAAGQRASPDSKRALAMLCERYWFPLYAFVRRSGYSSHDAEELTQEFLTQLIEKHYLRDVDRRRGKFRSFLLAAMKHFLSKQRDRARAKKRGGGQAPVSLDFRDAESRYKLEPTDELTPERLFERRWALTLLDQVLQRLQLEYADAGRRPVFERLKGALTGSQDLPTYRQIAEDLAMTEGAVKAAVHRLRRRYRELLKEEISQTVKDPVEIDEELKELFSAVRAGKNP